MLALIVAAALAAPSPRCALSRTVHVPTEDGATVALHHHVGAGPPVLMVHGISSNHRFWDLDADHSAAEWLAARGRDVWLLDLRGHGDAERREDGRPQRNGWKVDHYALYDVPAAVAWVEACTGYDRVAYVGHSMGGMVGAMYAASGGADHLSALVLVGSPATFSGDVPLVGLVHAGFAAGGATHFWFDTPVLAGLAADLGTGMFQVKLQERLYNPENLAPATIGLMLRSIVSPLSRGEMRHFARMIQDGRLESWDRSVDYLDALRDVWVPTFVVVGAGDRVAAPEWVEPWADTFAGPVQVFRAGTESGLKADYGHLDLGLGERAATEIFPRIAAWLDRWAGPSDGSGSGRRGP